MVVVVGVGAPAADAWVAGGDAVGLPGVTDGAGVGRVVGPGLGAVVGAGVGRGVGAGVGRDDGSGVG